MLQEDLTASIAGIVQKVIGSIPEKDTPLMEAGLDSLGAVELRNALASQFAIELPATLTFDYPSIAALSDFLASATLSSADAPDINSLSASLSEVSLIAIEKPCSSERCKGLPSEWVKIFCILSGQPIESKCTL